MSQRTPYTSQTADLQMERGVSGYAHPEPTILMGGAWQSNMQSAPASGVRNSINLNQLPERHDRSVLYPRAQYDSVQQNHAANYDLGVSMSSNVYYPYLAPLAVPRLSPIPVNYGSPEQLVSFSNSGVTGGSSEEYGQNHFKDNFGGSYKRKNAESTSSSFAASVETRADGMTMIDPSSHTLTRFRENDGPMGMNSIYPQNTSEFMQGSYFPQSYPPAGALSFDQSSRSTSLVGGPLPWGQAPVMPYIPANTVDGVPLEVGNMGVRGSHETDRERRANGFLHSSHFPSLGYAVHHQVPLMHTMRDHNAAFSPQIPTASFPVPHGATNIPVDGIRGPRHLGSFTSTGFRMYQPPMGGVVPETNPLLCNIPHLRVLPVDEVAILDLPEMYTVGNHIDHHRDMRMDIEDMSYEELLALGERIGSVNTGLSEEAIARQLKTRDYLSPSMSINLEEVPCMDKEAAACIICQDTYENQDTLGILDCGHEYHADCLKKWLLVKNVCPICKSEALAAV